MCPNFKKKHYMVYSVFYILGKNDCKEIFSVEDNYAKLKFSYRHKKLRKYQFSFL